MDSDAKVRKSLDLAVDSLRIFGHRNVTYIKRENVNFLSQNKTR